MIIILVILGSLSLRTCAKVPAGYQGVIVNLYGSHKGIAEETKGVGRYLLGWNEELYLFPTFLQNYTWTQEQQQNESITMQTSEGLTINTDVGITYNIKPNNVVKVFQKYRLGIREITDTFLRNMVRDAMNKIASSMTVEQIYGSQKEQFMLKVNQLVSKEALDDGIDVDRIYLIGSFRLPQTVIDSINTKIQASQNAMKVENEIATTRAEAQKTIIEAEARAKQKLIAATAEAKGNEAITHSLSPELVHYMAMQRWDGKLPQVTGAGAMPFINLKKQSDE